jgi:hypothetical protein
MSTIATRPSSQRMLSTTSTQSPFAATGNGKIILGQGNKLYRLTSSAESTRTLPSFVSGSEALFSLVVDQKEDIAALQDVVMWQKHLLDYQALNNAYQLGTMTADEFEAEAENFVSDYVEPDVRSVTELVGRLHRLLPFKMSVSEYADFFRVEPLAMNVLMDHVTTQLALFEPAKKLEHDADSDG